MRRPGNKRQREDLDFTKLTAVSFQDPIFSNTHQREWLDHNLYSDNQCAPWVTNDKVTKI
jgi:hypothetical protein